METEVSCIVPVKNCPAFLTECLISLLNQKCTLRYEVCMFNDGSDDGETQEVIERFASLFRRANIPFRSKSAPTSRGVGYAKNRAVSLSKGRLICFCDADDINEPTRLQKQFDLYMSSSAGDVCLIGAHFSRLPAESTPRYTKWACELSEQQLYSQMYTSFGPTIVAPTWFTTRAMYDQIGGFDEQRTTGFPEDLDFFYKAVHLGVRLLRVDEPLVVYRHHDNCSTLSVNEQIIWDMRVRELERNVLQKWSMFTIWNAGKQGKRFFRSLSAENQAKVVALCDVDENKIARRHFKVYNERLRKVIHTIPIVHHSLQYTPDRLKDWINFREANPPIILCMKMNLTNGGFEENLIEKNWREGVDFFHFN